MAPGSSLTLDGRGSAAVGGASITAYQWSQVSGPPATLGATNGPTLAVTLPAGARDDWVFRLLVTDSAGRSADNYVTVTTRSGGGDWHDDDDGGGDRKSTRLNSSHQIISYAVFCLKKKMGQGRCGPRGGRFRHVRDPAGPGD